MEYYAGKNMALSIGEQFFRRTARGHDVIKFGTQGERKAGRAMRTKVRVLHII